MFHSNVENKALHSDGYQVTLGHGPSPSSRMSVQQKWQDIWARPKKGERKCHLAYSAETAQRLSGGCCDHVLFPVLYSLMEDRAWLHHFCTPLKFLPSIINRNVKATFTAEGNEHLLNINWLKGHG